MQHWVHSFRHHWVTSNQWQRANEAANQSSHFRHHKTKPHKQQPYRNPDFASFKLFFFSLSPCPAVSNKCCKWFSAWQARAPTLVDCLFQFLWCSTTQLSQNFSKMTQKHPVLTQQLALKLSVQLFSCPSVWFHLYLLDIQKRLILQINFPAFSSNAKYYHRSRRYFKRCFKFHCSVQFYPQEQQQVCKNPHESRQ